MAKTLRKYLRFLPPALGQVASAGSQFFLSLQLLHTLPPEEFGAFSFLLITVQLGYGISSALLCAPYPLLLGKAEDQTTRQEVVRCFMSGSLFYALAGSVVLGMVGLALGLDATANMVLLAYTVVMLLRWFARSHAYSVAQPMRAAYSDIAYGAMVIAGTIVIRGLPGFSLAQAFGLLLLSAFAALLPFGPSYLLHQFYRVSLGALKDYLKVWRDYARWSLLGVITTEATANAHAYLVTLIVGPSAFAPIAAAQLLIRPITLTQNALGNFERPPLAAALSNGRYDDAFDRVSTLRRMLFVIYGMTLLLAGGLWIWLPDTIFPPEYDRGTLIAGLTLWFLIAGLTTARTPESLLLQALGEFRPLAWASAVSGGLSVVLVVGLLLIAAPVWSLAGVLAGQAVMAALLFRKAANARQALDG